MTDLSDLARRWTRQTEVGKGIRLDSGDMDALARLDRSKRLQTAFGGKRDE